MSSEIIENTLEPDLTKDIMLAHRILKQVLATTHHNNRDTQNLELIIPDLDFIIKENLENI